jgi:hypothetical protein
LSGFGALLETTRKKSRGPSPSFTAAHLVLAFLVVGDTGAIGRQALAQRCGLGDGAVRTVLKRLKEMEFLRVTTSGCELTDTGRLAYRRMRRKLSGAVMVEDSPLTVGRKQAAVKVNGGASLVKSGIEQRDSAIRVGALGATTYVIKGSKFTMPGGSSDCERDFPSPIWTRFRSEMSPRDGDALVLGGSDDGTQSELGAIAAALTLV